MNLKNMKLAVLPPTGKLAYHACMLYSIMLACAILCL